MTGDEAAAVIGRQHDEPSLQDNRERPKLLLAPWLQLFPSRDLLPQSGWQRLVARAVVLVDQPRVAGREAYRIGGRRALDRDLAVLRGFVRLAPAGLLIGGNSGRRSERQSQNEHRAFHQCSPGLIRFTAGMIRKGPASQLTRRLGGSSPPLERDWRPFRGRRRGPSANTAMLSADPSDCGMSEAVRP